MDMSNFVYLHFAYERRLVNINANMLYPGRQKSSRSLAARSLKSEVLKCFTVQFRHPQRQKKNSGRYSVPEESEKLLEV